MYWVNVCGKGDDTARVEHLSDDALQRLVPLLAALGAGVQFGNMGSETVEGGCFRQAWLGGESAILNVVAPLPGRSVH